MAGCVCFWESRSPPASVRSVEGVVMSVREAAESGDRRRMLEALKLRLASAIDEASDRDLAALARRLVAVVDELDGEQTEGGSVDDLSARRKARRAEAAAK